MKKPKIERRRTIGRPGPYATREPGFYTHMFIEHIQAGLMAFHRTTHDRELRVNVEGDEAGKIALAGLCTSLSDYPRYHLSDNVEAGIESIAVRLAWFGEAVYEICGSGDDISLANVMPYQLYRVPGGFFQMLSKEKLNSEERRYAFLPTKKAWVIRIPRQLGGSKGHRRLLNKLTEASQAAPDFWTRELQAGKFSTDFVFADYNRNRDAYIAWLTRGWGWNRRDSGGTNTTEFFYFLRSLRFRRAQALLRDHIVAQMNKLLFRLRLNTHVRLEGFYNATQIDDLIKRALDGTLHYAEALRDTR